MEVIDRLARIETRLDSLPCVDNSEDIKKINNKLYFFSGVTAVISFLINHLWGK